MRANVVHRSVYATIGAAGFLWVLASAPVSHAQRGTEPAEEVELLVQLKPGASILQGRAFNELSVRHDLRLLRSYVGGGVRHMAIRNRLGRSASDVAAALMATGAVEFAEVNATTHQSYVPNDPYFAQSWHHTAVGSATAWDTTTGDPNLIVAVCDAGVDLSHPELAPNVLGPGYDVIDGTNDGGVNPDQINNHGTLVSGVIAAVGGNGMGVAGMMWSGRLLSIKISHEKNGNSNIAKIVACIDYARTQGARIVNVSYDGLATSTAINAAATALSNAGGLLVVSAGNAGAYLGSAYSNILVIGWTDRSGVRVSTSNWGPAIDLVGPSVGICTTGLTPAYGGQTYNCAPYGTSMSAPIVAGVAGLVWSFRPLLTVSQVRSILFTSATDRGRKGYDTSYGYGIVNAKGAMAKAATY